ncbi:MAG: DNA-processing protein DprA [Tissierellaceae bacterium]
MDITNRDIIIWLNSIGASNLSIQKLNSHFLELKDIWEVDSDSILKIHGLSKELKTKILANRKIYNLEKLFKRIKELELNVITIYDESYPKRLRYIYDSPSVLYTKGKALNYEDISIAIVGSRKSTAYGRWACEKFAKELVDMGVTIVSGLAAGIDAMAHKTALENSGTTIGILGNGINVIYPKKNLSLYKEMEENGTIISEFPIDMPPLAHNFPLRNRIISGLSLGVIIIEAQEKSGSLITAHHALEQGKDVFALPGNINSIFSKGTNKLIKDGARPLLEIEDIIEEIHELKNNIVPKKVDIDYSDFSDIETKVLKSLEEGPLHSDTIVYKTGLDISTINSVLTILELKGVIKELTGRTFVMN